MLWLSHAILGFLAWGLLAPTGTIISAFRKVLFRRAPIWDRRDNPDDRHGRTWVKLHRYINETVMLLTWILFSLAAVGVKKGHHFRNAHQIVGAVIFLLTFPLWILGRILMPPKVPKSGNSAGLTTTEQTTLIPRGDGNDDGVPTATATSSGMTPKERILILSHRILGAGALVAGLWEIYSGISIYSQWFPSDYNLVTGYAYWCGVLILLLIILVIVAVVKR